MNLSSKRALLPRVVVKRKVANCRNNEIVKKARKVYKKVGKVEKSKIEQT